ncbi:MAG: hypothetical protein M1834_006156 [Cirrosporium novae-zelandiae]|nr:MAG: hypothetical protein M1834_006156 [Cirrosporium novae-zelandiae]
MALQPSPESVTRFIEFANVDHTQAIRWIKAHGGSVENALGAFFEDPKSLDKNASFNWQDPTGWDESQFHIDKAQDGQVNPPAYDLSNSLQPDVFNNAPTRTPSRVSNRSNRSMIDLTAEHAAADPSQSMSMADMSIADREQHDLDQAVAASLNYATNIQENGVTDIYKPSFGPANRDHYDANEWAMTISSSAKEVVEPYNRRRESHEPAFIKPSMAAEYLPALLTILHQIPLAKEALLVQNRVLADYGYDNEWWDGATCKTSKIVTLGQEAHDSDQHDLLSEVQRLMSFLNLTDRAYGSCENLVTSPLVRNGKEPFVAANFYLALIKALDTVTPGHHGKELFQSVVHREREVDNTITQKTEFCHLYITTFPSEYASYPEATLYDAIDELLWGQDGESDVLEESIYIANLAEVITIHLEQGSSDQNSGNPVEIPIILCADRYHRDQRKSICSLREERVRRQKEVAKYDRIINRIKNVHNPRGSHLDYEKLFSAMISKLARLDDGTQAKVSSSSELGHRGSQTFAPQYGKLGEQLEGVRIQIQDKLKSLENKKQEAYDHLGKASKIYTQYSDPPPGGYKHAYTLRGAATDYGTIFFRSPSASLSEWWMINVPAEQPRVTTLSQSQLDDQTFRDSKAPYSLHQVEEQELKVALKGTKWALLVYASEKAMEPVTSDIPPQLMNFIRTDNHSFEAEIRNANTPRDDDDVSSTGPMGARSSIGDEDMLDDNPNFYNKEELSQRTSSTGTLDFEKGENIPIGLQTSSDPAPTSAEDVEMAMHGQEMEEKSSAVGLLGSPLLNRTDPSTEIMEIGSDTADDERPSAMHVE